MAEVVREKHGTTPSSSSIVLRHYQWRSRLIAWAEEVRGQPYQWGETDCMALGRTALRLMFDREVLPALASWDDEKSARRRLVEVGSAEQVLRQLGAVPCALAFFPSGTIVLCPAAEHDDHRVILQIYVEPILVASAPDTGVVWCKRDTLPPDAVGWVVWEARITDG